MTPTRTRTRAAAQQRRAATEQAILDATRALLEEHRFNDLGVEDVMAVAGLGRTAFYRYFPDLETVVVRLMGTLVEELRTASVGWLASGDPEQQLYDSLLQFAAVYRDHGRLMRAFFDAAGGGPDLREQWGTTLGSLVGPVELHTQRLMQEGRADLTYPVQTIRALAVLTDAYLLDVYWRYADVDVEQPTAVLFQIWTRTLRLR
jgi:AcrR family transcriptional regulator